MFAGLSAAGRLFRTENLQPLMRWGLVLVFLWLAGRFWHPYYGFTRFLQFDDTDAAVILPELREAPIYVDHFGGYDGVAYAQLAARPGATDPELARSVDSLAYRARRILLSWIAYAAGGGDPVRAVQVYAGLNLVVWLGVAWLLARLFPPRGWRNLLAWAGLLFSAGALHSVRLALTDLAGLGLVAAGILLAERRRDNLAAVVLGAAGLVRETTLLGGLVLWRGSWREHWVANLGRLALAALPLGLWMIYLRVHNGPILNQGLGNFEWPVVGWCAKLTAAVRGVASGTDRWLALTTLMAFAGLTVQFAYLLLRRQPDDRVWRLGVPYALLMLGLGGAVWAGHPGAATRVLLPLGLAFNLIAVRGLAAVGWMLAGNLTVFSGVFALWNVPRDAHELTAGRIASGAYVVHTDARWYGVEYDRDQTWAWCAADGGIQLDHWPRIDRAVGLHVAIRAITPRPLEIRQSGRVLWSGVAEEDLRWIALPVVPMVRGRVQLELASPVPAEREAPTAGARDLGFAVYGVKLD